MVWLLSTYYTLYSKLNTIIIKYSKTLYKVVISVIMIPHIPTRIWLCC